MDLIRKGDLIDADLNKMLKVKAMLDEQRRLWLMAELFEVNARHSIIKDVWDILEILWSRPYTT